MSRIHWVPRQNKLEIPNDEEEVNTREIHKFEGQAYDADTMVDPLTPNCLMSRRRRCVEEVGCLLLIDKTRVKEKT